MKTTLLRFYRSTEGIVVVLALYALAAFGIWTVVTAGVVTGVFVVPFAVVGLMFGGLGIYLWAEAFRRLLDALVDSTGTALYEVMGL